MIIDIALLMSFATLAVLSGWLIDGLTELRQIKRAKLIQAHRRHPAGRML